MISLSTLLTLLHLTGLALALGAATIKVVLLLKVRADRALVPIYLEVARPISRQIILGMVLLTMSGVGWLLLGYPFTTLLVVKLSLVGAIWVFGPVIEKVVEPRFKRLATAPGQPAPAAFVRIQRQYLTLEVTATLLFYVIVLIWAGRGE